MDAGWAAVVGAVVGALASILTSVLLTIPGLIPEDRANRIDRTNRLNALVVEISEHFIEVAQAPDGVEGFEVIIDARTTLLRDRVELASLVRKNGDQLMDLLDACLEGVSRVEYGLLTSSASVFSAGAADWLRHGELRRNSTKGLNRLRSEITSAKKLPRAEGTA